MNTFEELTKKMAILDQEKILAIKNEQYEKGAQIRDEQHEIQRMLDELKQNEGTSYNSK